jgi:AraC family transcriptional regulator
MKVAVDVLGAVGEPYLDARDDNILRMVLHPGFVEMGARRSTIGRTTFPKAGEIRLCPRNVEHWFGSADLRRLAISISNDALTAVCGAESGNVELSCDGSLVDARVEALVASVNAERAAGFPNGRLFLDSVEQALAVALVNGYAVRHPSPRIYRGGLTPARLRRVTELVEAKIDDDLSLEELAESVELSRAHFSQMFRKSTGQSPHQYVLRHRVQHAKQILRTGDLRVLDVAVTCGFKTQQHFARVFRQICGISPTEYRQRFLH